MSEVALPSDGKKNSVFWTGKERAFEPLDYLDGIFGSLTELDVMTDQDVAVFVYNVCSGWDASSESRDAILSTLRSWRGKNWHRKRRHELVDFFEARSNTLLDLVASNDGSFHPIDAHFWGLFPLGDPERRGSLEIQILKKLSDELPGIDLNESVKTLFADFKRNRSYPIERLLDLEKRVLGVVDFVKHKPRMLAKVSRRNAESDGSENFANKASPLDLTKPLSILRISRTHSFINNGSNDAFLQASNHLIPREEGRIGEDTYIGRGNASKKKKRKSRIRCEICPDFEAFFNDKHLRKSVGKYKDDVKLINEFSEGIKWQNQTRKSHSILSLPKDYHGSETGGVFLSQLIYDFSQAPKSRKAQHWSFRYVNALMGLSDTRDDNNIRTQALQELEDGGWIQRGSNCIDGFKCNDGVATPYMPTQKALRGLEARIIKDPTIIRNRFRDAVKRTGRVLGLRSIQVELMNFKKIKIPPREAFEAKAILLPEEERMPAMDTIRKLFALLDGDITQVHTPGAGRRIFSPVSCLSKKIRPLFDLIEVDISSCHLEIAAFLALCPEAYGKWCNWKDRFDGKAISIFMDLLGMEKERCKDLMTVFLFEHRQGIDFYGEHFRQVRGFLKQEFPELESWIRGIHFVTRAKKHHDPEAPSEMSVLCEAVEQDIIVSAIEELTSRGIIALNLHDGILTTPEASKEALELVQGKCHQKGIMCQVSCKKSH